MHGPRFSAEQQIRQAQARGAFDNLPGAGRPLKPVDLNDPDWWVKGLIEREQIDTSELVHPTLALRMEAESYPDSLVDLRSEDEVRAVLEDFNDRVRAEWRRPQVGPSFPVVARLVRVEETVAEWHRLREERLAEARAAAAMVLEAADEPRRRRWWRRRRRSRTSEGADVSSRG